MTKEEYKSKGLRKRWREIPLFDKLATSVTIATLAGALGYYFTKESEFHPFEGFHPFARRKAPTEEVQQPVVTHKYHVIKHERIPWEVVEQYFPEASDIEKRRRCNEYIVRNPDKYDRLTSGMRTEIPPDWERKDFKIYISNGFDAPDGSKAPEVPFDVARRYFPDASTDELRKYAEVIKKMNPDKYDKIVYGTRLRVPRNWELKVGEPWQEIGE
jgi:hypothetical protein